MTQTIPCLEEYILCGWLRGSNYLQIVDNVINFIQFAFDTHQLHISGGEA